MAIRHIVSSAIESGSRAIDAENLAWLEDCFECSLRDVQLHFSHESTRANFAMGSAAFALRDHICFRAMPGSFHSRSFKSLLAHEIVHVIQQRQEARASGILCASKQQLEVEAGIGAARAMNGLSVGTLTCDHGETPRCYGPAGHYYTALFTAIAAGLEFKTSQEIAFYTQFPDLVCELDAIVAGKDWGMEYELSGAYRLGYFDAMAHLRWWQLKKFEAAQDLCVDRMIADWQIQAGLHALTGNPADGETEHRGKILANIAPTKVPDFGLAVHAYGDSFAHRDVEDGDYMYGAPAGHLMEAINQWARSASEIDPHEPDNINSRKPLYAKYAAGLFKIFCAKSGRAPLVSAADFDAKIAQVAEQKTEQEQADTLKRFAQETCVKSNGASSASALFAKLYEPPMPPKDDAIPWESFKLIHLDLTDKVLRDSQDLAAVWCASAEPFKCSVHWDEVKRKLMRPIDNFENEMATVLGLNLSPEEWMRQMGAN